MFVRLTLTGLLVGLGVFTSGCTDGYGYFGVDVGYGSGGYYDPYAGGYGYVGPASYYGWYGDYYYPGSGVYVYDRNRRRHRWNDGQRRYWEGRRGGIRGDGPRGGWADLPRGRPRDGRRYRDHDRAGQAGVVDRNRVNNERRQAQRELRGQMRQERRDFGNRGRTPANRGAGPRGGSMSRGGVTPAQIP